MTSAVRTTLLLALLPFCFVRLSAEESHVRARLLNVSGIVPGGTARVEIEFEIDADWHIYWRNPGDAGTATEVEWKLPEGYSMDGLVWPLPHTIGEAPEVSYGYEGKVTLFALLHAPASAKPGESVEIGARVRWLVCHEICIPGGDTLRLRMPVHARVVENPRVGGLYDEPPLPLGTVPHQSVEVSATDSFYILKLAGFDGSTSASLKFYPYDEAIVDHSAPQRVEWTDLARGEATMTLRRSPFSTRRAESMRGVIVVSNSAPGRRSRIGVEIERPVR